MKRIRTVLVSCAACVMMFVYPNIAAAQAAGADTLIDNVRGYTMYNGKRVEFSALAFADGVVTAIYPAGVAPVISTATRRLDGGGATLLPGLIDAHGHVTIHGRALASVDLLGVESEQAAAERVRAFIAANGKAGDWIRGRGWNQVLWPGKAFPRRASLDAVSGDSPVALRRVDSHAMWVNSRALALAGIDASTSDPEGGKIVRDADGAPTGLLIDNAVNLLLAVIPGESVDDLAAHQLRALQDLATLGLTAVHDARTSHRELLAYRSLQETGQMPVRVYAMLHALDPENDQHLARGPVTTEDGMLSLRSMKISADGALGSRGAALYADYSDDPGNRGLMLLSDAELTHHIRRGAAAGFQVNVHAIGDRANGVVLDEFAALNADPAARRLRHRVEHAQVLRPADIARFRALDVIASIQPTHATSDMNMAGDRLGEERLRGAYAWHTLLSSGAKLAGGSDFPVEYPNPFFGLHAAVTRQGKDNQPDGGWLPGEKLTREESLSLFTEDAAYAGHEEQRLGRLLPGYTADFILLRDDYFAVPEEDIWKNRVLQTWVAGEKVYEAQ